MCLFCILSLMVDGHIIERLLTYLDGHTHESICARMVYVYAILECCYLMTIYLSAILNVQEILKQK